MLQPPTLADYLLTILTALLPFVLLFVGVWRLRGSDDLRNRIVSIFGLAMLVPIVAIMIEPVLLSMASLLFRALSLSSATLTALPGQLFWQGALLGIVAVALRRTPPRQPTDAAWLCTATALGALAMVQLLGIVWSGTNWPRALSGEPATLLATALGSALIMGHAFVLHRTGRLRRWVWLAWLVPAAYGATMRSGAWEAGVALNATRFAQANGMTGMDWLTPLALALPFAGLVVVAAYVLPRLRRIDRATGPV